MTRHDNGFVKRLNLECVETRERERGRVNQDCIETRERECGQGIQECGET